MVVLEKLIIPECIQATKLTNPIAIQLMVVKMFPILPKDSPSLIFLCYGDGGGAAVQLCSTGLRSGDCEAYYSYRFIFSTQLLGFRLCIFSSSFVIYMECW